MSAPNLQVCRMIKIDAAYIYEFGARMRALLNIPESEQSMFQMNIATNGPREALLEFMLQSVFKEELAPVAHPAGQLLEAINKYQGDPFDLWTDETKIFEWEIQSIKEKYRAFENVLYASLRMSQMYYVSPKGGYNTACLTDIGESIFPKELANKVPDALTDIKQATKCIAFELPTAAGFHLHRANESVLRVYWDSVTGGRERPEQGNMGVYIVELNKLNKGKKSVRERLKSIKDFHRNPLMHPEQSLDTVEEAIGLLAAIRCSIGYMLEEIDVAKEPLQLVSENE